MNAAARMTTASTTWNCRPGRILAGTLALALAALTVLAGLWLTIPGEAILWFVAGFLLSLWMGFKGAPLLLRAGSRLGLFGRIRLDGSQLEIGRSSRRVDLDEPFTLEARLQQSEIRRSYDMHDVMAGFRYRPRRKTMRRHELGIVTMTLTLQQAGRTFCLVGDETDRHAGREIDLEALTLRRVGVGPLPAAPLRLWPADVAEILQRLQASAKHEAVTTPIPDTKREDPRKAIWPTWKAGVAAAITLGLTVLAGVLIVDRHQIAAGRRGDEIRAAALRQKQETEQRAQALVGRRVGFVVRRARFEGRVRSVRMFEDVDYSPSYSIEWIAYLKVEVDRLIDRDGKVLPAGAELPDYGGVVYVKQGDITEVRLDRVEAIED